MHCLFTILKLIERHNSGWHGNQKERLEKILFFLPCCGTDFAHLSQGLDVRFCEILMSGVSRPSLNNLPLNNSSS